MDFLVSHIIDGEIKKGKSVGIHFFQKEKHQLIEITKPENKHGVYEAKINVRHPKTNNWVSKEKPSTFFPNHWNEALLIEKLKEAFDSQKRVEPYQAIGKTSCGVRIAFFYKENNVVGCFPMYD